eukprot:3466286-Lingulodinium_polyedra.AAC.1
MPQGLACSKPASTGHMHAREITAYPQHPAAAFMRRGARALRVAQRLSGRAHWTLWCQADAAQELQ